MLDDLRESCEPTIVLFFAAIGRIATAMVLGLMIGILVMITWDSLSDWRWKRNIRHKREKRGALGNSYNQMREKYPDLPENPKEN